MFIKYNFLITFARTLFAVSMFILFAFPAASSASTVTFNSAGDMSSWQDPANWSTGSVPGSADDAIIPNGVSVYGTAPTPVHNLTVGIAAQLSLNVTVTGIATFNGGMNTVRVTGNAVFNDGATNIDGAVITGNATFNTGSGNFGGIINGLATFNDNTFNDAGVVQGSAVFNGTSRNLHTVVGNASFYDSSINDGFNGDATVQGNACFAPGATNTGTVNGTISVCFVVSASTGGYPTIQTIYGDGSIETTKGGITVFTPSSRGSAISISASSSAGNAGLSASSSTSGASSAATSTAISSAAASGSLALFTKSLGYGMLDPQVRLLQLFLNSHNFTVAKTGNGSLGQETSYFGSATRAALSAFQKVSGLMPSIGVFGPITRAFVNDIMVTHR